MRIESDVKSINLLNVDEKRLNGEKNENGSVYAGGLSVFNDAGTDAIEEKRKKAQKMALQLVSDAFSKDKGIDDDLDSRRVHVKELEKQNAEYKDIVDDINEQKGVLKEQYGITEESEEQKELELLQKNRDAQKSPLISLTDEEKQQINDIYARGLTPYQDEMLKLDGNETEYKNKITDNEREILQENAIIRGVKIERLETHDMVDAVKQGDVIKQAASDEIMGMLRQEGMDNIDERIEEEKEEREKKKEEAEKLKERIEAAKADKSGKKDDNYEDMYEFSAELNKVRNNTAESRDIDVSKSLNQIINELILTTEDLKGIVVDADV